MTLTGIYAALGQIYDLGASQLSRVLSIISLVTMIGVWKTTIEYFGFTVTECLILAIVGIPIIIFMVGLLYYRKGGLRKTNDMINDNNEQWQEHRKKTIENEERLDRQEKLLNQLLEKLR